MAVHSKYALVAVISLFSANSFAETAQLDYWYSLISAATSLTMVGFFLLGIAGFGRLTILYAMQILGAAKDSLGRRNMRPMNAMKFMAGTVLCSAMVVPFSVMKVMGDITGLSSNGRPMCFVTGIESNSLEWSGNANACMDHVESRLKSVSGFESVTKEGMDYVKLFFGIIQLTSLFFFGNSISILLRHAFGYQNIQVSVAGAFLAMFASSVLFMLPNVTYYIEDVFFTSQPIIQTGK